MRFISVVHYSHMIIILKHLHIITPAFFFLLPYLLVVLALCQTIIEVSVFC